MDRYQWFSGFNTRGGKECFGQLAVSGDIFDLLYHIHQPPHDRGNSPVAQNPREQVKEGRYNTEFYNTSSVNGHLDHCFARCLCE